MPRLVGERKSEKRMEKAAINKRRRARQLHVKVEARKTDEKIPQKMKTGYSAVRYSA